MRAGLSGIRELESRIESGDSSRCVRQLVTRSMSDSPISRIASIPSVTAVVACCATSFATRVTRVIGDDDLAGELALRLMAGRLADDFLAGDFLAADFLELAFLALDFLRAGPRRADVLAPDFRVELLRAEVGLERFADFFGDFFALDFFADFLPPPDFPRDFLARVAISLTLVESVVDGNSPRGH